MNELFVWCMMFGGHFLDSRYTGTFTNLSEVSMSALWMSEIGWPAPSQPDEEERRWRGGLVRGWYQRCCGVEVASRGWGQVTPTSSVWHPDSDDEGTGRGGVASSEACQALGLTRKQTSALLVCDPGTKITPSLNDSGFLLVFFFPHLFIFFFFGAATKCAMCYVAWFSYFSTSYKSPFVVPTV